eukprot:TRINITY_DN5119_c0_g2_i1.p2 TRINITY_DN5119_c0_g2~~TRINITY_DN5119_c0_g2_i1.p2  ORF type:complete len:410 (+),score=126.14 TRINITY_DN5119_c0_g2_i1:61-1290(+)
MAGAGGEAPIGVSAKLRQVKEYYFSRKLKEIAQLRAAGRDVVSLAIGSPDLPPHSTVVAALAAAAAEPDAHGYQPYNGTPALREAFAAFYKATYGVTVDPAKEVLPLLGSKEGILHITMAFADPGDVVLAPDPGYGAYTSIAELLGVHVAKYNLTPATRWRPDVAELEARVAAARAQGRRVRILWANYPHMPTGTPGDAAGFAALLALCKRHGILLVNDNPYSLVLPRGPPLSLLGACSGGDRDYCLELNSLSKSHSMPGWRVGCVVGRAEYIQAVLQVKSNFDSGMFKPVQAAAAAALTALPPGYVAGLNAEYERRRGVVFAILDALGCTYARGQVGMFVWARAPDAWRSVEEELDRILHQAEVFLTPGAIFGGNGARYVRASLCTPIPRLKEALRRVQKYIGTAPSL